METGLIIVAVLIGLPWIILHYVTRWKTSATLSNDDEAMLEELYQLARRLEERMHTVERLVASDDPDFRQGRKLPDRDDASTSATKDEERTFR